MLDKDTEEDFLKKNRIIVIYKNGDIKELMHNESMRGKNFSLGDFYSLDVA